MSLSKIFKLIMCVVLLSAIFSGCMRETNLKDLTVIEGIAINDDGNEVEISIQSLNVATSTGTEKPQGNMTVITTEKGDSIVSAITNLSKSVSKELFFGQNKMILFSREVCENNFENKLDYILRFTQSRADVLVCMVDGDVKEVIKNSEDDSHVPIENLVYLISNGEKSGNSVLVSTNDLLNAYADKTSDIYLPVVKERFDKDNSELSGIAIFSDGKLSYVLNEDETLGFSIINNELKNCLLELDDEKLGIIGIQLSSPRVKKSVSYSENGLVFNVDICGDIIINEIENGVENRLNRQDVERITDLAEKEVCTLVTKAFKGCKAHNSDVLRVGEYLARDYPKLYNELSANWIESYNGIAISPSARLKITKISDNIQLE